MRILVSGFEPFNDEKINGSWEVAQALPPTILGAEVLRVRLPCVFGEAGQKITAAMREYEPDIVVSLGEHQGGLMPAIERVALNIASTPGHPDMAGYAPYEEPLVEGGPFALPSTLDVVGMSEALVAVDLPHYLSCTAGLYVCNSVMYAGLYEQQLALAEGRPAPAACGFIHVPATTVQAAQRATKQLWASMPKELTAKIVETCLAHQVKQLSWHNVLNI